MRMFFQRHLAPVGQFLPPWTCTAIEPSVPSCSTTFSLSYLAAVECRAVEDADLLVVDPGRDVGVLARADDAGRVPVVDLPGLDPLFGRAGGDEADFGRGLCLSVV